MSGRLHDTGKRLPRVAIVTHELTGGVGTMTRFVHRVLQDSAAYQADVIHLATSASDDASVLLRRPSTWIKGPHIVHEDDGGFRRIHVGSWAAEIETFRYQPRRGLTQLLEGYDILQFVVGTAPWLVVAEDVRRPKCVWVASTNRGDRSSRAGEGSILRRLWSARMMAMAEAYENKGLASADSILALSPYTAASLHSKISPREAVVAPCGVDTELFRPGGPVLRDGQDEYILCVGRPSDARKNIALLLRAYEQLWRTARSVPKLCLVGGELPQHLMSLARHLGIADMLLLPGSGSGEALAAIYRNASFFVLSSDEEGLGIVILEAMASGLAVVSTDSGGPSSIVEHGVTGLITPVGDIDALSSAMLRLCASPELRHAQGTAGRQRVEERFSIPITGGVFTAQYERLLA